MPANQAETEVELFLGETAVCSDLKGGSCWVWRGWKEVQVSGRTFGMLVHMPAIMLLSSPERCPSANEDIENKFKTNQPEALFLPAWLLGYNSFFLLEIV